MKISHYKVYISIIFFLHQLGPLGPVGLVVAKSVCFCVVIGVFVPFPCDFFLRGLTGAERASSVDWCNLGLDLE